MQSIEETTSEVLRKMVQQIVGLEYKGIFYIVDYVNLKEESRTGDIEFICIDHENNYISDKTFETELITFTMLLKDKNSKLFTYKQIF